MSMGAHSPGSSSTLALQRLCLALVCSKHRLRCVNWKGNMPAFLLTIWDGENAQLQASWGYTDVPCCPQIMVAYSGKCEARRLKNVRRVENICS